MELVVKGHLAPLLIEISVFPGQFTEDGSFIGQYVPGKLPVSPLPTLHSQAAAQPAAGVPGMSNGHGAATYV